MVQNFLFSFFRTNYEIMIRVYKTEWDNSLQNGFLIELLQNQNFFLLYVGNGQYSFSVMRYISIRQPFAQIGQRGTGRGMTISCLRQLGQR